ncbi:MAG: DUF2497 domain-containing protein [Pseudomonadota bacterium]
MADNTSEQEPSIEEILASIRQIISDDDEDNEPVESPVQEESDDVLELTEEDLVEEEPEMEPEPERDIVMEEPEPEPPMPEEPRKPVPSDIMSSSTQAVAMSSLSKLTSKMPINSSRTYDGVTLEDIVRELLHPMLREWMDDNLPNMVERNVQKELEKLARRALDD